MKTITGTVNFVFQRYSFQDFLNQMDKHNCEVLNVKKGITTHTITVRGTDDNLDHARWFFRNCGTLL